MEKKLSCDSFIVNSHNITLNKENISTLLSGVANNTKECYIVMKYNLKSMLEEFKGEFLAYKPHYTA